MVDCFGTEIQLNDNVAYISYGTLGYGLVYKLNSKTVRAEVAKTAKGQEGLLGEDILLSHSHNVMVVKGLPDAR